MSQIPVVTRDWSTSALVLSCDDGLLLRGEPLGGREWLWSTPPGRGSGRRPEAPAEAPKTPQGTMLSEPDIGKSFIVAPRATVRQLACPRCEAEPGMRCWRVKQSGARYRGATNHMERVRAYLDAEVRA